MGLLLVKKKRFVVIVLFLYIISGSLLGCDPYANNYPYQENTKWVCSDPNFILSYSRDSSGIILEDATLEWDERTIAVSVMYQANMYCVSPVGSTDDADNLFNGTWEYQGNDLVLHIEEDYFFNGQYSELVFSKICNP